MPSLGSWNDTSTTEAIVRFAETTAQTVAPEERVAVFDNDGTLWCEKPMPVELAFILERLAAMAGSDESLRAKQPWQAAYEKDYAWLSGVIDKHYAGDESDVKVLMVGILQAFAGQTVDEYVGDASAFLEQARHPTLGRLLRECAYVPMIELLRYLESLGFTCYIASGGNRDFMRAVTGELYGIPPERVVGSSNGLRYTDDEGLGDGFRGRRGTDGVIEPIEGAPAGCSRSRPSARSRPPNTSMCSHRRSSRRSQVVARSGSCTSSGRSTTGTRPGQRGRT